MVLIVGLTVTVPPLPIEVPPQEPSYQCQPAEVPRNPPVRPRTDEDPSQIVPGEVVIDVATTDVSCTMTSVLTHKVVLHTPSALT